MNITSDQFVGLVKHLQLNATLELTGIVARRLHVLAKGSSGDLQIPVPPPIDPVTPNTSVADAVTRIRGQLTYSVGLLDVIK